MTDKPRFVIHVKAWSPESGKWFATEVTSA